MNDQSVGFRKGKDIKLSVGVEVFCDHVVKSSGEIALILGCVAILRILITDKGQYLSVVSVKNQEVDNVVIVDVHTLKLCTV